MEVGQTVGMREKHGRDHLYCIRVIVFPCFHTVFRRDPFGFLLSLSLSLSILIVAKFLFIVRFLLKVSCQSCQAYSHDLFHSFVSRFIEYFCLCVPPSWFLRFRSPLLFERRIQQPFGGRSTLSLSVLVSLMRRKRNATPNLLFIPFYYILVFRTSTPPPSSLFPCSVFYRRLDTSFLFLFLSLLSQYYRFLM